MASHPFARWLLLVLALALGGCAPVTRGTAKGVTEGATKGSAQGLADPATRQRVEEFVGSPEMQRTIHDLSDDIASGVTDGMTSDEVAARSERLARSLTESVTRAALQTGMRTMAEELPRTVGPAVAAMLHDQLEDPSFRAVLGSVVFEVSRQAVFGTNAATAELAENKRKQGAVAHLSGSVDTAGTWEGVAIAVLLAAVVGLVVALVLTRSKVRRHEVAHEIAHNVRHDGTDSNHPGPAPST